jgi:hypothetical protein
MQLLDDAILPLYTRETGPHPGRSSPKPCAGLSRAKPTPTPVWPSRLTHHPGPTHPSQTRRGGVCRPDLVRGGSRRPDVGTGRERNAGYGSGIVVGVKRGPSPSPAGRCPAFRRGSFVPSTPSRPTCPCASRPFPSLPTARPKYPLPRQPILLLPLLNTLRGRGAAPYFQLLRRMRGAAKDLDCRCWHGGGSGGKDGKWCGVATESADILTTPRPRTR